MSDNSFEVVKKRRKKGEGRESDERKRLRNSGKEYITKTNILVQAKQPPPANVTCKCKYKCATLSHTQKVRLFEDFYKVDHTRQQNYLLGLINLKPVGRRRHGSYDDPNKSRRQTTGIYTVPNGEGDIVQVCRSTFSEIFSLCSKRVQGLVELKKSGNPMYHETRGNKTKNRKFTEEDEDLICSHVNSFPHDVSHYGRTKTEKEYLSSDLNVSRLYAAFKTKYPETHITYRCYYDTFKKKFPKLSFHTPRADTCAKCDFLAAKIACSVGAEKIQHQNKLNLHHLQAAKARQKLKEDCKKAQEIASNTTVFSLDLQQVLSLPTLTHSNMYYMRQLSNYNLCTHFSNGISMMNMWHEGQCGRGGNEVASCVFRALKFVEATNNLTAWSDNCSGQNKNKILLFLWIYLTSIGVYEEIEHKFLVAGHSFLDCDRDFAVIEKRKRVSKCYVPQDLKKLIEEVREKNPFIVNMMEDNDFFNLKECCHKFLNTTKLNISKLVWLKVSAKTPGVVKVKKTFSELEEWSKVKVFRKGITVNDIKNSALPSLQCVSQLSEAKKNDLKSMINFLTNAQHKAFYENLTS